MLRINVTEVGNGYVVHSYNNDQLGGDVRKVALTKRETLDLVAEALGVQPPYLNRGVARSISDLRNCIRIIEAKLGL